MNRFPCRKAIEALAGLVLWAAVCTSLQASTLPPELELKPLPSQITLREFSMAWGRPELSQGTVLESGTNFVVVRMHPDTPAAVEEGRLDERTLQCRVGRRPEIYEEYDRSDT